MKKVQVKKKNIIIIAVALLVIVIAALALLYFIDNKKYSKYDEYSNKIEKYGFSEYYNNQKVKSSEYVSKLELAKLAIVTFRGDYDVLDVLENNEGQSWVRYANNLQIANNKILNGNNMNSKATYEDMIKYLANAKQSILSMALNTTSDIKIKNFELLSGELQGYVKDMIADGILDNEEYKINPNKKIRKGELNKLLVRYIEKYSTITNNYAQIQTDEEKMPSNKEDYPYIVKNVDKEVYEQPYVIDKKDNFANPLKMFSIEKVNYDKMVNTCVSYYEYILNINYNDVNEKSFQEDISKLVLFQPKSEDIKEYVDYIKENNIIVSSVVTPQLPIIYSDGSNPRIRLKLDITISNSNTKDNILFLDSYYNKKVTYPEDSFTVYIDAVMGYVYGSDNLYNNPLPIYENLVDLSKDKIIITER